MKHSIKIFTMLFALLLTGCGDSKKEKEDQIILHDSSPQERVKDSRKTMDTTSTDQDTTAMSQDTTATGAQDGEVAQLSLTGNDQMRFNKKELRVKEGQKVRLVLEHVGKLNVEVMGHNFVLLKKGTNIDNFAQRAAQAKDTDYIPTDPNEVIVHTQMIGGGETTSIEFDAPAKGTYTFICSFPGHYMLMQGQFIVE